MLTMGSRWNSCKGAIAAVWQSQWPCMRYFKPIPHTLRLRMSRWRIFWSHHHHTIPPRRQVEQFTSFQAPAISLPISPRAETYDRHILRSRPFDRMRKQSAHRHLRIIWPLLLPCILPLAQNAELQNLAQKFEVTWKFQDRSRSAPLPIWPVVLYSHQSLKLFTWCLDPSYLDVRSSSDSFIRRHQPKISHVLKHGKTPMVTI